jgi:hypothetical protein
MPHPIDHQHLQADLRLPWLVLVLEAVVLAVLVVISQTFASDLQQPLPESTREWIRTALYAVAIVTFPITNLLRHVQMRLNQTMPLEGKSFQQTAKRRYLTTIIVSMSLIQSPGIYGFVMFILGDSINTLTIFILMSALGFYLYRPKLDEYERIVDVLATQQHE